MFKNLLELISDHGDDNDAFKIKTTDEMLDKFLINEKTDYIETVIQFYNINMVAYYVCSKKETSYLEKFEKDYRKFMELLETDYEGVKRAYKNDSTKINETILIDIYSKFLKKDYTPPKKLTETSLHLRAIYLFYSLLIRKLDEISISTIQIFDFNLMRLLNIAELQSGAYSKHAEIELERLYKSKKGKAPGKDKNKRVVLAEFESLKRKNSRPHTISKTIIERLEKKEIKAPSTETIKNILKEAGKI